MRKKKTPKFSDIKLLKNNKTIVTRNKSSKYCFYYYYYFLSVGIRAFEKKTNKYPKFGKEKRKQKY